MTMTMMTRTETLDDNKVDDYGEYDGANNDDADDDDDDDADAEDDDADADDDDGNNERTSFIESLEYHREMTTSIVNHVNCQLRHLRNCFSSLNALTSNIISPLI